MNKENKKGSSSDRNGKGKNTRRPATTHLHNVRTLMWM